MSKLLQTRLPVSMNTEITSDIFNRLVRVLEINLGSFDSDNTRPIGINHFFLQEQLFGTQRMMFYKFTQVMSG